MDTVTILLSGLATLGGVVSMLFFRLERHTAAELRREIAEKNRLILSCEACKLALTRIGLLHGIPDEVRDEMAPLIDAALASQRIADDRAGP